MCVAGRGECMVGRLVRNAVREVCMASVLVRTWNDFSLCSKTDRRQECLPGQRVIISQELVT